MVSLVEQTLLVDDDGEGSITEAGKFWQLYEFDWLFFKCTFAILKGTLTKILCIVYVMVRISFLFLDLFLTPVRLSVCY